MGLLSLVVQTAIAQKSLDLRWFSLLLVDCQLIALVYIKELVIKDCSVYVNRVLMLGRSLTCRYLIVIPNSIVLPVVLIHIGLLLHILCLCLLLSLDLYLWLFISNEILFFVD